MTAKKIANTVWRLIAPAVLAYLMLMPPVSAVKLYGAVQHKEKLNSVEPGLRTGTVYNDSASEALTPGNNWFEIPKWMGGRWVEGPTKYIYEYDFRTGVKRKRDDRESDYVPQYVKWGWQSDRHGGLWQYCSAPYHYAIKSPLYTEHLFVMEMEGLDLTRKTCTVRFVHKNVRTNNKTGRVTDVFQLDALHTFTRKDNNRILERCSTKYFDENGHPTRLVQDECLLSRLEPYSKADRDGIRDMHALFIEFLNRTGRQYLVPESDGTDSAHRDDGHG